VEGDESNGGVLKAEEGGRCDIVLEIDDGKDGHEDFIDVRR